MKAQHQAPETMPCDVKQDDYCYTHNRPANSLCEMPGLIDGRLWWEGTTDYWELPFYSEMGLTELPDRAASLAAREQLFALRELADEGELSPMWPERETAEPIEPDI